jgi:hypothetical protein
MMEDHRTDLNQEYCRDFANWGVGFKKAYHRDPTEDEQIEYAYTVYHWQAMNTLIRPFGNQKYNGEYIFKYSSWNHDIKLTQIFIESDFRKYLRLLWDNKIPYFSG